MMDLWAGLCDSALEDVGGVFARLNSMGFRDAYGNCGRVIVPEYFRERSGFREINRAVA